MARTLSKFSKEVLALLEKETSVSLETFYERYGKKFEKKEIYNTLFRLTSQELIKETKEAGKKIYSLSEDGQKAMFKHNPKRDGVWKIIVFDIPESKRFIRNFIRAKLKNLGFKKWQNSIWVSPYALDKDLEDELQELATKIFVRLIKTTDINYTKDLEKLFE